MIFEISVARDSSERIICAADVACSAIRVISLVASATCASPLVASVAAADEYCSVSRARSETWVMETVSSSIAAAIVEVELA